MTAAAAVNTIQICLLLEGPPTQLFLVIFVVPLLPRVTLPLLGELLLWLLSVLLLLWWLILLAGSIITSFEMRLSLFYQFVARFHFVYIKLADQLWSARMLKVSPAYVIPLSLMYVRNAITVSPLI